MYLYFSPIKLYKYMYFMWFGTIYIRLLVINKIYKLLTPRQIFISIKIANLR